MTQAIAYNDIATAIKTKLEAYAALAGVTVAIEDELILGTQSMPWVGIYLMRRTLPEGQSLSYGTRTRLLLTYSIWCWQHSLDGQPTAIGLRNSLIGNVELALMSDRTLGGAAATSWLEGGDVMSGRPEGGSDWMSGGEVILTVDAQAIA